MPSEYSFRSLASATRACIPSNRSMLRVRDRDALLDQARRLVENDRVSVAMALHHAQEMRSTRFVGAALLCDISLPLFAGSSSNAARYSPRAAANRPLFSRPPCDSHLLLCEELIDLRSAPLSVSDPRACISPAYAKRERACCNQYSSDKARRPSFEVASNRVAREVESRDAGRESATRRNRRRGTRGDFWYAAAARSSSSLACSSIAFRATSKQLAPCFVEPTKRFVRGPDPSSTPSVSAASASRSRSANVSSRPRSIKYAIEACGAARPRADHSAFRRLRASTYTPRLRRNDREHEYRS